MQILCPISHQNQLEIHITLISKGNPRVSAHDADLKTASQGEKEVTCDFLTWIPHWMFPLNSMGSWNSEPDPQLIHVEIVWCRLDVDLVQIQNLHQAPLRWLLENLCQNPRGESTSKSITIYFKIRARILDVDSALKSSASKTSCVHRIL